jgi:hypothetical protein
LTDNSAGEASGFQFGTPSESSVAQTMTFAMIFRSFSGSQVSMVARSRWRHAGSGLLYGEPNCELLVAGWLDVFAPNLAINVVL